MITITYNPGADLKNWLRIARTYPVDFQLTKEYPFDRTLPLRDDRAEEIIASLPPERLHEFQRQAEVLVRSWRSVEETTVRNICQFLGMAVFPLSARANLTTAYLMPYDVRDQWFMVPTHKPLPRQLEIITHEVFHLCHARKSPESTRQEREGLVERFMQHRESVG